MKRLVFAVFLLGAPASAQHPVPDPSLLDPQVFQMYSLATMKVGDNLVYETAVGESKSSWRLGCVSIDDTSIWIESDMPTSSLALRGKPVLYCISKETGIVTEAYRDVRGKIRRIELREVEAEPSEDDDDKPLELTATSQGKDNQRVGAEVLSCDKVEMAAKWPGGDQRIKARLLLWTSSKVPLKYRDWESSGWLAGFPDVKWTPRKAPIGGLVRAEIEAWKIREFKKKDNVAKIIIRLLSFTRDAKADLFVRKVQTYVPPEDKDGG